MRGIFRRSVLALCRRVRSSDWDLTSSDATVTSGPQPVRGGRSARVRASATAACVAAGLLVLGGSSPAHAATITLLHGWTVASAKAFTATAIDERDADEIELTLTYAADNDEVVKFTFDHNGAGGSEGFFYVTFKITNSDPKSINQVNMRVSDESTNSDSRAQGEEGDDHPLHAHIHPDLGDAWLDHQTTVGDKYTCIDASTRFGDCNGQLDDHTFLMSVEGADIAEDETFDGKLLRIHDAESTNGDMTFVLTMTMVPEPSTALLLASGLVGLSWRRRRR